MVWLHLNLAGSHKEIKQQRPKVWYFYMKSIHNHHKLQEAMMDMNQFPSLKSSVFADTPESPKMWWRLQMLNKSLSLQSPPSTNVISKPRGEKRKDTVLDEYDLTCYASSQKPIKNFLKPGMVMQGKVGGEDR